MTAARSMQRVRTRRHRVPRGFATEVGPPFDAVLALGSRGDRSRFVLAGLLALGAHGLVIVLAMLPSPPPPPTPPKREIPVVIAAPVKPPPKPEPKPEPPPEPPKAVAPKVARVDRTPPAPAQAGKVISAAPDPSQPLDMTDFAMVTGKGNSYAGGVTTATGKSTKAVTSAVVSDKGKPDAPPVRVAPPAPSLSKPPGPARRDWSCTWPDEEQDSELHDARVSIRVQVDPDGAPLKVDVLNTPSPGFGEAARRCALQETYRAALDDAGKRVSAITSPFLVHFVR
jgi:outer membrane biosynthesis protein TonB